MPRLRCVEVVRTGGGAIIPVCGVGRGTGRDSGSERDAIRLFKGIIQSRCALESKGSVVGCVIASGELGLAADSSSDGKFKDDTKEVSPCFSSQVDHLGLDLVHLVENIPHSNKCDQKCYYEDDIADYSTLIG